MKISKKIFDSIIIDEMAKTFTILNGTEGTYCLNEIVKCSILNEDAKYKGKTQPFLHQVLGGTTFVSMLGEPLVYVGLKIKMSDDRILAVYVSKKKCVTNSDLYFAMRTEAEKIKKVITDTLADH